MIIGSVTSWEDFRVSLGPCISQGWHLPKFSEGHIISFDSSSSPRISQEGPMEYTTLTGSPPLMLTDAREIMQISNSDLENINRCNSTPVPRLRNIETNLAFPIIFSLPPHHTFIHSGHSDLKYRCPAQQSNHSWTWAMLTKGWLTVWLKHST